MNIMWRRVALNNQTLHPTAFWTCYVSMRSIVLGWFKCLHLLFCFCYLKVLLLLTHVWSKAFIHSFIHQQDELVNIDVCACVRICAQCAVQAELPPLNSAMVVLFLRRWWRWRGTNRTACSLFQCGSSSWLCSLGCSYLPCSYISYTR